MKTILHIGKAKTGSTSIQSALSESRAYLAGQGLLYPTNPILHDQISQKVIAGGIFEHNKLPVHISIWGDEATVQEHYRKFCKDLTAQIQNSKPDGLILSSESLGRTLSNKHKKRLGKFFKLIDADPVVSVYLRRPSQRYLSLCQQTLRRSHNIRRPRHSSYRGVLESYGELVGKDNVRPRIFDRAHLVNGDVVADFATHFLSEWQVDPAKLTPPDKMNETLSGEAMLLLQLYRETFHGSRDQVQTRDTLVLVKALRELDEKFNAQRPRLRDEIADMVDYLSDDLLWVRDNYGLSFDNLDYARLERGDLIAVPEKEWSVEDIIQIDKPLMTGLAEALKDTEWAQKEETRATWASQLPALLDGAPLLEVLAQVGQQDQYEMPSVVRRARKFARKLAKERAKAAE